MANRSVFPRLRARLFDPWLKRRIRPALPLTLAYRRIFILPTRFGFMLALLMAAMFIGSLNFNNNMGLATTFIVAAVAINSMLLAFRNINGLELRQGTALPVHAGNQINWQLTINNPGTTGREGLILSAASAGPPGNVPANTSTRLAVTLPPQPRGWHKPGRLRLETTHPLGLFRAWAWFEPDTSFLVWPAPAAHAPPLPQGDGQQPMQQRNSPDDGDEFHSLRRWREGDPLHRIAWKASQRHQTLLSRDFRREQSQDVSIHLSRVPAASLEERISIATAWVLRARSQNMTWTLHIGARQYGPGFDDRHKHDCLRALAEL